MARVIRPVPIIIAILGVVLHLAFGFSYRDLSGHAWGTDDAYISYRYAQNLADGHGLVFNRGERVEGYTNFLYTLLATVFVSIDPNITYFGCSLFNILLFVATLLLFHRYLNRITDRNRSWLGYIALCSCPIMWVWPGSGLETSSVLLVQLALFITVDSCGRRPSTLNYASFLCLAGVAVLLRADGFIFPLLCCVVFLLRKRYWHFCGAIILIVILMGIYVAARYSYYGEILPNTFYARVSGTVLQRFSSAAHQLIRLWKEDAFFLYLIPLALGWRRIFKYLCTRSKWSTETIPSIPVIALGLLAYWFYVGGDMLQERFLLVLIPLSIAHLVKRSQFLVPIKWTVVIFSCFITLQFTPFLLDRRFEYRIAKYDRWVELGKRLANDYSNATIAIDAAGKVPFYSRLHTIDMLGLNDAHVGHKSASFVRVGHNKYDPDYIFSRKPDLIAAWGTEELDLAWGITRRKYIPAGYTLKYVVNATPDSKEEDIITVTGFRQEEIEALYAEGYEYFVIDKEQSCDEMDKDEVDILWSPGVVHSSDMDIRVPGSCRLSVPPVQGPRTQRVPESLVSVQ